MDWIVETWSDGRVSITAEGGGGDVVAWIEPGMERFADLIASAPVLLKKNDGE